MSTSPAPRITAPQLTRMKRDGQRITMLTAYDATFAHLLDQAGIDVLLVGDSLGMVIQGAENTLAVTVDEIVYHTRAVARATRRAHVVADMPFMSYQASEQDALHNAGRLIKEGGAHAVKLEGGRQHAALIARLSQIGIPVMGHIGLTPQSVHAMGGYRVQGRRREQARELLEDALALQDAGAYSLVLEGVPRELAAQITDALEIPTIGIGAGPECDGQVLVIYDMLGMDERFAPKFVKRYDDLGGRIRRAVGSYIEDVRSGTFPAEEHSFSRKSSNARAKGDAAGGAEALREERVAETIPLYSGKK